LDLVLAVEAEFALLKLLFDETVCSDAALPFFPAVEACFVALEGGGVGSGTLEGGA
jgi:hypothetical protein